MGTEQMKNWMSKYEGEFVKEENSMENTYNRTVTLNKGHGRLVDADALAANIAAARYEVDGKYEDGLYLAWSIINDEDATPTVIPAEEEK